MKNRKPITTDLSLITRLRYYGLYYLSRIVGLLPAWFLYYPLVEALYFLLYYLVRYRVKVTRQNLTNSFPERGQKELRSIERKYYRHLAELFIDTIDLSGITAKQLRKRMVITNEAEQRREVPGIDWIAGLAHYGSWEYFMVYSLNEGADREVVGVYKSLHDKSVDLFYRRIRSRFGTPVSMSVFLRHLLNNRKKGIKTSVGLIADQSPPWFEIDYWYDFLGQPTPFYKGMETMALRFGMPVYFLHLDKVKRAHYTGWFECIYDGKEEVAPHEITKRYVAKLEEMIRERPELWMWSHKRWKHNPNPEQLARQNAEECL